ncbi:MAG: MarR family winged helix-turn-helix transcriptional regulator [Terricaulis sp.]|nr:MarR family winged helix-turn-helix transcriptional regulator [Terricaulis sp.]
MASAQKKLEEPAARDRLVLEQFLPYRLSILSNRVSRAIAARYAKAFDLTIPEWRIIAVLGRSPGLSAKDIAEATEMDKVAVSRAVARLSAAGRITGKSRSGRRAPPEAGFNARRRSRARAHRADRT